MPASKTPDRKLCQAFTLVELVVVIGVVALVVALSTPVIIGGHRDRSRGVRCLNNLKQVCLAFSMFASDFKDRYPMSVPPEEGGALGITNGLSTYRHFLVLSNYMIPPRLLFCSEERDPQRRMATRFDTSKPAESSEAQVFFTSNTNLSYFVGLDNVAVQNPAQFLSGDRNLNNSLALEDGVMHVQPDRAITWQGAPHSQLGNIGFNDGSARRMTSVNLQTWLAGRNLTNRLSMPVLD